VNLLGHELFSRTALAIDQHGRLGAGHAGNGLVDRQHLGTAANQARCWLDGFKPNLELLILLNKSLLLQRALHNRFDFINVEGLADVVKGALADSFNCRLQSAKAADQDDLGFRQRLLELLQQVKARQPILQVDVADDDVRLLRCPHCQCILRILSSQDLDFELIQQFSDEVTREFVVVNNEEFLHEAIGNAGSRFRSSGTQACNTGTSAGRRIENVVPTPGSLFTAISPPCSLTMARQMLRPRPVPWPISLVVNIGSKSRSRCAG